MLESALLLAGRVSMVKIKLCIYLRVKTKAYSLDFRQKIFDTYLSGGISQRQLAKRFCVSLSFVEKLLKQYKETENIALCIEDKTNSSKAQL